jgi:hypothetical protein
MNERERCRRPCGNCPWRKDAPREYWDAEHFREIWRNCQDDGLHQMACHKSRPDAPAARQIICQGWVRVMGYDAIGVRIALLRGRVTLTEIEDLSGLELFETFEEMLLANRVEPPARNRFMQDAAAALAQLKNHNR